MARRFRGAKSMVMQPCFRSRTEKALKGKGSYRRKPRVSDQDSRGFSLWG